MVRSLVGILLAGLVVMTAHVAAAEPRAWGDQWQPTTIVFPYRQRTLLYSRNPSGALAYVTSGAPPGATLPIVVFLHGINAGEEMNMWFGGPRVDLRSIAEELVRSNRTGPFIVAAPTHTRYATGASVMWPRFDLADFLTATEAALGETARVDRSRVIVVGHSAAGCNPTGGIVGDGVRKARPMAVVAVDTCVSSELTVLAATVPVRFYWQRSWSRPIDELAQRCTGCVVEEIADLRGIAHDAILPEALRRALPALLPSASTERNGSAP
jgi:hypothetical protein